MSSRNDNFLCRNLWGAALSYSLIIVAVNILIATGLVVQRNHISTSSLWQPAMHCSPLFVSPDEMIPLNTGSSQSINEPKDKRSLQANRKSDFGQWVRNAMIGHGNDRRSALTDAYPTDDLNYSASEYANYSTNTTSSAGNTGDLNPVIGAGGAPLLSASALPSAIDNGGSVIQTNAHSNSRAAAAIQRDFNTGNGTGSNYSNNNSSSNSSASPTSTRKQQAQHQTLLAGMAKWSPLMVKPWPSSSNASSNRSVLLNSNSIDGLPAASRSFGPTRFGSVGSSHRVLGGGVVTVGGSTNTSTTYVLRRDVDDCRRRVVKLEKAVASLSAVSSRSSSRTTSSGSSGLSGASNRMVSALAAYPNTLQLTPRTIRLCSAASHFLMGAVLGASLLDRLWLVGGIGLAWWAADATGRDSKGGAFARKVGIEVASQISEWQEKYNQAVIFYRTGKLAYVSSKTWERYDRMYSISQRIEGMKQLTKQRAAQFNSTLGNLGIADQVADFWHVMQNAPSNARQLDQRYRVTRKITNAARTTTAKILSIGSQTLKFGEGLVAGSGGGKSGSSNRKASYSSSSNRRSSTSSRSSRLKQREGLIVRVLRGAVAETVNLWRLLVTGEEPIRSNGAGWLDWSRSGRGRSRSSDLGWTAGGTVNPWSLPFVGDSSTSSNRRRSQSRPVSSGRNRGKRESSSKEGGLGLGAQLSAVRTDQLVVVLAVLLVLEVAKDVFSGALKLALAAKTMA